MTSDLLRSRRHPVTFGMRLPYSCSSISAIPHVRGHGTAGATTYADGYTVTLVDPVPLHVQQAEQAANVAARAFSVRLGDASNLPASDSSADAVLLMGPMYHLDAEGRRLAVAEALRVLHRDGVLVAAAISRFSSLLDGLRFEWLADEAFAAIVAQDLATGQHRNPDPVGRPEWFTTAWFHRPDERASLLMRAFTSRRYLPSKDHCGCSATWIDVGRTATNEARTPPVPDPSNGRRRTTLSAGSSRHHQQRLRPTLQQRRRRDHHGDSGALGNLTDAGGVQR